MGLLKRDQQSIFFVLLVLLAQSDVFFRNIKSKSDCVSSLPVCLHCLNLSLAGIGMYFRIRRTIPAVLESIPGETVTLTKQHVF